MQQCLYLHHCLREFVFLAWAVRGSRSCKDHRQRKKEDRPIKDSLEFVWCGIVCHNCGGINVNYCCTIIRIISIQSNFVSIILEIISIKMKKPDLERVKRVVNWLIYNEYAKNKTDLASKLGYTKSSLSQILSASVPLSDNFVFKLTQFNDNIVPDWIYTGRGEMLRNVKDTPRGQNIFVSNSRNVATLDSSVVSDNKGVGQEICNDCVILREEIERLRNIIDVKNGEINDLSKDIIALLRKG